MKLKDAEHVLKTLEVLAKVAKAKHADAVDSARHCLKTEIGHLQAKSLNCQNLNKKRNGARV